MRSSSMIKGTVGGLAALGLAMALATWAAGCEDTGIRTISDGVGTGPSTVGAGCSDDFPSGFPYQPDCCEHTISLPEVSDSGFDTSTLGGAPEPDHIHVSWPADPQTTLAVNWHTDLDTLATQLLLAENEADLQGVDEPDGDTVRRFTGHHVQFGSLLSDVQARIHEVHICGLEPDKTYYYKVGAPGAWSEIYDAATAPVVGSTDPIRFGVTGDTRDQVDIWAQVNKAIWDAGSELMVFTGDAVNVGANQNEWNDFFEAESDGFPVQDALARMPLMVVNGNHDNLSVNFAAQFAMPNDTFEGEQLQGEAFFSFDYGNVHFIGLNDTPENQSVIPAVLDWLRADLEAVDRELTPWIIAYHHKPMYACGGAHDSRIELRAAWQPIFDQHEVDIVFAGHNHLYERTAPIRGLEGSEGVVASSGINGVPVNQSGTMYITTAGGGAELYGADDSCNYMLVSERTHNHVIVDVDDRSLSLTAYRLDGTTLDSFTYDK